MKGRRFGIIAVSVAATIGAAVTIGHAAGLRLNFTDSAPHGLWIVRGVEQTAIKRGELVEVCPPDSPLVRIMGSRGYLDRGDCPGSELTTLLKPISAVAGDTISVRPGEPVQVNGVELPNTAAMPAVPGWPAGRYQVQPGEVWLFSSYSAGSFDSRYFGPVPVASVRGIATPVAVHGSTDAITTGVTKQ